MPAAVRLVILNRFFSERVVRWCARTDSCSHDRSNSSTPTKPVSNQPLPPAQRHSEPVIHRCPGCLGEAVRLWLWKKRYGQGVGQGPRCLVWQNFTRAGCVLQAFEFRVIFGVVMQTPLSRASSAGTTVPCQPVPQKQLFSLHLPHLDRSNPKHSPLCCPRCGTRSQINPPPGGGVTVQAGSGWFGVAQERKLPLQGDLFLQRVCVLLGGFRWDLPRSLPMWV